MIAAVVAFALFAVSASPALAQSCADPGPSPDGNLCETIVPGAGCKNRGGLGLGFGVWGLGLIFSLLTMMVVALTWQANAT